MSKGDDIRERIPSEYEKTPGYLIWDITEAVGQEMELQDKTIEEVESKLDVDNLTGEELERFVWQRKGVERKAASYADGVITVQGTGTVTKGDLFETANGVQFQAKSTEQISGTGKVPVEALIAGNSGVVGAGTITQIPVTITGISACTNEEATSGGYDAETDAALKTRYYNLLRTPATSGNKYAYKNWALEVQGVGDAQVYPLGHGDSTVDVVIIDSDKKPADSDLVAEVQEYIDPDSAGKGEGAAPIGARCYVSSAAGLEINLSVKLTTSSVKAEIEAAVKKTIVEYLAEIAFQKAYVSYAQIGNAIIGVEGVTDYENLEINGGTANITVPDRSVAIIGQVVFSYAE